MTKDSNSSSENSDWDWIYGDNKGITYFRISLHTRKYFRILYTSIFSRGDCISNKQNLIFLKTAD